MRDHCIATRITTWAPGLGWHGLGWASAWLGNDYTPAYTGVFGMLASTYIPHEALGGGLSSGYGI